jgi:hypothetical protein
VKALRLRLASFSWVQIVQMTAFGIVVVGLGVALILSRFSQDIRQQAYVPDLYPSRIPEPSNEPVCCLNGKTWANSITCSAAGAVPGACPAAEPTPAGATPCCMNGLTYTSALVCTSNASAKPGACPETSPVPTPKPTASPSVVCCVNGQTWTNTITCSAAGAVSGACKSPSPVPSPSTSVVCCVNGQTWTNTITCSAAGAVSGACKSPSPVPTPKATPVVQSGCKASTCVSGKWCGEDGKITNLQCNTQNNCDGVSDGSCTSNGYRCINGRLYVGNGCVAVVPSPIPSPIALASSCRPSSCTNGKWCGSDGKMTSLQCGNQQHCGDVKDGSCSSSVAQRCLNGVLVVDTTCRVAVVASPIVISTPLPTGGQCYFGVSSCSSLNRTSAGGCSGCGGVCCGAEIPQSAKVCTPGQRICMADNAFSVCNSNGTGTTTVACKSGEICRLGACEPVDPNRVVSVSSCLPFQVSCLGDGVTLKRCAIDGKGSTFQVCEYGCASSSCNPAPSPGQTALARATSVICCVNGKTWTNTISCSAAGAVSGACPVGATPQPTPAYECKPSSCVSGQWCGEDGRITSLACNTNKPCGSTKDGACASGQRCLNGTLYPGNGCAAAGSCSPGSQSCSSSESYLLCGADGRSTTEEFCPRGEVCRSGRCFTEKSLCDKPATCIGKIWCGANGVWSGASCNTRRHCNEVKDGTCSPEGQICLDGALYDGRGNGCTPIVASQAKQPLPSPVVDSKCYFGSTSCAAFGRYTASDFRRCGSCSNTSGACCGDIIPVEEKICQPNQRSCNNNRVSVCKSDGTGYLEQSCDAGTSCQGGNCVKDEGACTCNAVIRDQNFRIYGVSVDEGNRITDGYGDCSICMRTAAGCSLENYCEAPYQATAIAADSDGQAIIGEIEEDHPTVSLYGSNEKLTGNEVKPVQIGLDLLPEKLTKDFVYIVGGADAGGLAYGVWDPQGNKYIQVGTPGCEGEGAVFHQNRDVKCGYGTAIFVHETIHEHTNDTVCRSLFDCTTAMDGFVDASAEDGVYFQSETNKKSKVVHVEGDGHDHSHPPEDFLLYNEYNTSDVEGFAITSAAYVMAPEQLKLEQPHAYEYLKEYIFEGREYLEVPNENCDGSRIEIKTPETEALQDVNIDVCDGGR